MCLQIVNAHPPCPSDKIELSEVKRRMEDLKKVHENHPLLPIIQLCLNDAKENRPAITAVSRQITKTKGSYQYVMSMVIKGRKVSENSTVIVLLGYINLISKDITGILYPTYKCFTGVRTIGKQSIYEIAFSRTHQ